MLYIQILLLVNMLKYEMNPELSYNDGLAIWKYTYTRVVDVFLL